MVREELNITVPSLFRCPISLDVMKSPVSLSTGVTYDRSSIQHWLESGHDTCPATNQPLPSKDFVPNLTLHRLINLWIHSAATSGRPAFATGTPSSSSSPSSPFPQMPPVMSSGEIRQLVSCIARQPGAAGVDGLAKVAEFASYCEENRRFLANLHDSIEAILRVIVRESGRIEVLESAIRVLDLILLENGVRERIHRLIFRTDFEKFFDSVLSVLRKGTIASKIQSARVLELIIASNADSRRTIGEKETILAELVRLLRTETDKPLTEAILSSLISFSATRPIKAQLVELGVVPILSRILSDPETTAPAAEGAIKMVHLVSSLTEGRRAISEDPICTLGILDRLMKLPRAAKEEGVAVLWSMCCTYRDSRVKERVGRENGVTKLLVVMQSEGGDGGMIKRMCGDLVKALRVVAMAGGASSYGGLGSLETKTTHIRPY